MRVPIYMKNQKPHLHPTPVAEFLSLYLKAPDIAIRTGLSGRVKKHWRIARTKAN